MRQLSFSSLAITIVKIWRIYFLDWIQFIVLYLTLFVLTNNCRFILFQYNILTAMLHSDQQNQIDQVPNQFDKCNRQILTKKTQLTIKKSNVDRKLTHGMNNYREIKFAHTKNNTKRSPYITKNHNCTFQPKVTSKDKKGTYRSFEQFIDDQNQFLKRKQTKLKQKKLQVVKDQAQQVTGRPSIDRNSQKISTNLSRQSNEVFKRLSKEKKMRRENQAEQTFFQPKILNYSKDMIRTNNVSNLLYEDAKRRAQKSKLIQSSMKQKLNAIPFINTNSNNLVKKKLLHEFQSLASSDYVSTAQALQILCLIFHLDLPSPQICSQILAYLSSQQNEHLVRKNRLWKFIQIIIGIFENNQFTEQEAQTIYQQYGFFYLQRLSRQKKQVSLINEYSFKPTTLRASSQLAEKHRQKMLTDISEFVSTTNIKVDPLESMRIEDLFIMDYIKKKNSYQNLKIKKQMDELNKCSFRPQINTKYNKNIESKVTKRSIQSIIRKSASKQNIFNIQKESQKKSIKRSLERSTENKPKKISTGKENVQVKNMDKQILRMSLGRKNRQFIHLMKQQRQYPKVNDWQTFRKQQRKQIQLINSSNKGYKNKVL